MEAANILIALGGDHGNTVPRYGVTPSEIAVLRAIHGEDAVRDIEPLADPAQEDGAPLTQRSERARLQRVYGNAKDGEGNPVFAALFPGAAARVFETLAELDLPPDYFKADRRLAPRPGKAPDRMTKAELVAFAKARGIEVDAQASKDEVLQAVLRAEDAADDDEDDEIGEIADSFTG